MPIQTVTPEEVERKRRAGDAVVLIDVRTPGEYATVHADGAVSIPLDQLEPAAVRQGNGEAIYVICQSGARGAKACEQLVAAGISKVFNVEGGTAAWRRAGLPVVVGKRRMVSLERQVRVAAGALVLIGAVLGWHVHPAFHVISAVVGAGLLFAGATDWCGMGLLLARMPWNRSPSNQSGVDAPL